MRQTRIPVLMCDRSGPELSLLETQDSDVVETSRGVSSAVLRALQIQFVLRFFDFASVNLILPTLLDYVTRLGGGTAEYYQCLAFNAICTMLGTTLLGVYIDKGEGRMLRGYIGCAAISCAGNMLYVVAGSIPMLASPLTLMLARGLVGMGSSSSVLCFVFISEVCSASERQKWIIRYGMTRSQGMFWGPPFGLALAGLSTSHVGIFGADTLPAWFHGIVMVLGTAILSMYWKEPQIEKSHNSSEHGTSDRSLRHFLLQSHVLAVLASLFFVGTCQVSIEASVPIAVHGALGWSGAACGSPLTIMAVMLTLGQLSLVMWTSLGIEDSHLMLLGALCFPIVLSLSVTYWQALFSFHFLDVVVPYAVLSYLGPYAMLGGLSTYARLASEEIPSQKGACQAIQNNLIAAFQLIGPCWLAATYSGQTVVEEKVPHTCFVGMAIMTAITCAGLLGTFRSLRPHDQWHKTLNSPLVQSGNEAFLGC